MGKTKTPLNVTIDSELVKRLEAWINKQVAPPSKSATVEAAIRKLLEENNG